MRAAGSTRTRLAAYCTTSERIANDYATQKSMSLIRVIYIKSSPATRYEHVRLKRSTNYDDFIAFNASAWALAAISTWCSLIRSPPIKLEMK